MLPYYNVHVSKNRVKFSRFPEHHWVASSMICAFYPTTFSQLGVYNQMAVILKCSFNIIFNCVQRPTVLTRMRARCVYVNRVLCAAEF